MVIAFDFGGTLDTHGRHWSKVLYEGWRQVMPSLEWEHFMEAYVTAEREMHTEPSWDFMQTLTAKCRLEASHMNDNIPDTVADEVARWCHHDVESCIDSSRHVLDILYKRYPLILVSNFYGNLNSVLLNFSLSAYFTDIIESAQVGIRKPDPAIYGLLLERHPGLQPEDVLVVGDSMKNDILPAQSLGMKTLRITCYDDLLTLTSL